MGFGGRVIPRHYKISIKQLTEDLQKASTIWATCFQVSLVIYDMNFLSSLLYFQFKDGYGTKKDRARALSYFQLAAHGGHLHAIFSLGEINAEGKVVKRNCNFAVEVSLHEVNLHCLWWFIY